MSPVPTRPARDAASGPPVVLTVAGTDSGGAAGVAAGIKAFEMLASAGDLRERLGDNTAYFRQRMTAVGFDIRPGVHPISPVMLYDAPLAQRFAERLLEEGIYAIGFFFPVVAKGQARIRTQISAAHTREQLDRAIDAFTRIGRELGVLKT